MMCGGLNDKELSPDEIEELECLVQATAGDTCGENFEGCQLVACKQQVVQGVNYFIKFKLGDGSYVHVRLHRPLPCYGGRLSVHSCQTGKSEQDEIVYF